MKEQFNIERDWELAKLLVTNCDCKMLLFKLPQYGLYLQSLIPIPIAYKTRPQGMQIRLSNQNVPHIATVRYQKLDDVIKFIQEEKGFRIYRIFKHGLYFPSFHKHYVIGLICETTKNMLQLFPNKVFRIKSSERELQDMFYEKAVEINEEDDLGCSFDYDEYDYTLEIRAYKRYLNGEFHRWAIITILYGEDLLNNWNMQEMK